MAVNGAALQGLTHSEAIAVFKEIKSGAVMLHVGRRDQLQKRYVRGRLQEGAGVRLVRDHGKRKEV